MHGRQSGRQRSARALTAARSSSCTRTHAAHESAWGTSEATEARSSPTRSGVRSSHRAPPVGPADATSTRTPSLRKGAATAVGMIDGFVYLGTAVQSIGLGYLTSRSWSYWPWFLMPFSLAGFLMCLRIWNAKPAPKKAAH